MIISNIKFKFKKMPDIQKDPNHKTEYCVLYALSGLRAGWVGQRTTDGHWYMNKDTTLHIWRPAGKTRAEATIALIETYHWDLQCK